MRRVKLTALLVACLLIHAAAVRAEDITVMTSGAFTDAYLKLSVPFAHDTQHKIITAVTTMGVGAESIPSRMARGETVDVVIVAAEALDALIKDGRVLAGSRVDLARSSIGMAVRAGAPKPDISSVEALTRTLVNAKSIAYSASVSGDYLAGELFQRLGIVDQMKGKATRIDRERVGAVVAARRRGAWLSADQRAAAGAGHRSGRPVAAGGAACDDLCRGHRGELTARDRRACVHRVSRVAAVAPDRAGGRVGSAALRDNSTTLNGCALSRRRTTRTPGTAR